MKGSHADLKRKISDLADSIREEFESFLDLLILELLIGHNTNPHVRREKLEEIQLGYYNYRNINLPKDLVNNEISFGSFDEYFGFLKGLFGKIGFELDPSSRRTTVKAFKSLLRHFLVDNLESRFDLAVMAKSKVENEGIVFIDEIDKIIGSKRNSSSNRSPSTDGVQRDLLPIVEGTSIKTSYGNVKTNYILFIAAGAFSETKPQDMLPELLGKILLFSGSRELMKGRFPVRIDLRMLRAKEFKEILSKGRYGLIPQYKTLLEQDNIHLGKNRYFSETV